MYMDNRIRACVGEQNYKYFLMFIGSHAVLCLYGGVAGVVIFWNIIVNEDVIKQAHY